MQKKVLTVKNLKKIYHTNTEEIVALDNISFDLFEGEILSIVGPSGCGKSTILSIICGLENKSSGSINIENNKRIGYMLQSDCLFNWRNVIDNCMIGLEIEGKNNEENKKYVMQLLNKYGLKDFIYSKPDELSGGMRQRVALIRTLATKPDILLLDESFSALDYQSRINVANDVYNILKSEGKSAILVTHDIAESVTVSDRVIVLTKRPASIKKEHIINLTNKKDPINNRKCIEFNDYYDLIWKELDYDA